MKPAGLSSLIFPGVQLQPAEAAALGAHSPSQNSIAMMNQHDLNTWNDLMSRASGRALASGKHCVNVWHHTTGWLWVFTVLQWGHQYVWELFKEAAAPPAGWSAELLHLTRAIVHFTLSLDTKLTECYRQYLIIQTNICDSRIELIMFPCSSNHLLIQPFRRTFLLSCLFLCDVVQRRIRSLTFSKFARALLLTFLLDMLSYLRVGDKMHTDKGQTLQPNDLPEQSDRPLPVGGW